MTDYASRRAQMTPNERAELDSVAFDSHLPSDIASSSRLTTGAERTQRGELPHVDVAIVTIQQVEFRAVCKVFAVDQDSFDLGADGLRYFHTEIESALPNRNLHLVVALAEGAYDLPAARVVKDLTDNYSPDALFLVGIAAGNPEKLNLGDVLLPRKVMNYEAGRLEVGGARPRPRYLDVPREVAINFNHYSPDRTELVNRIADYCARLPKVEKPSLWGRRTFRPKVINDNSIVASGAQLVADGEMLNELRDRDELIRAADQESYGFATGCHGRWWGIFRGVSDHGDPRKVDGWQTFAASAAALTARDFLEAEYLPPDSRR